MERVVMNKQDVFNVIYKGLASQDWKQSVDISNGVEVCRYRGDNGMKCAAGHLIPDHLYLDVYEGISIASLQNAKLFSHIDYQDHGCKIEYALSTFQYMHDKIRNEDDLTMKQDFDNYAEEHGFTIPD